MSISTTQRLQRTVSRVPNPLPYPVSVAGKFLLCGLLGQLGYLLALSVIMPSIVSVSGGPSSGKELEIIALMVSPSLIAAVVYTRLPTETVDIYHRFGKGSALFFSVNVALSAGMVATTYKYGFSPEMTIAANVVGTWAISSMFLPGVYIGCLVAARWSR